MKASSLPSLEELVELNREYVRIHFPESYPRLLENQEKEHAMTENDEPNEAWVNTVGSDTGDTEPSPAK